MSAGYRTVSASAQFRVATFMLRVTKAQAKALTLNYALETDPAAPSNVVSPMLAQNKCRLYFVS